MPNYHPPTIFTDIDGTILEQKDFNEMKSANSLAQVKELTVPFQIAVEKLKQAKAANCPIILTTARHEELREFTEAQMLIANIPYDQLVMGIGRGERILINNLPSAGYAKRATAFEVEKDNPFAFQQLTLF